MKKKITEPSKKNACADTVQNCSMLFSLWLMVILRKRVGFRLLKPSRIAFVALLLYVTSEFALVMQGNPAQAVLACLAIQAIDLVFVIMAIRTNRKEWKSLNSGLGMMHTYSGGISRLEALPVPEWFGWHRRVYRVLDPLLCILVGSILLLVSKPLGAWVIASALFLAVYEQLVYEKALEAKLDLLDSLAEAEFSQQMIASSGPNGGGAERGTQLSLEDTVGIPTGLAPDLDTAIAKRQARVAIKDNLASEGVAA